MSAKRHWTITELAKEFHITTRTIRFYQDQGILSPMRNGQQRIYSARDRTLLKLTLRGKRLGFTLAECREMYELYDPDTGNITQLERMLNKLEEKRSVLMQQLHDIQLMQIELDEAERRINEALTETKKLNTTKTPTGDNR